MVALARKDNLKWMDSLGVASAGRPIGAHVVVVFVLLLLLAGATDLLGRRGLLDHPVEDEVVLVAHSVEEVLEQFSQVADVWLLFELEAAAIVEVDAELIGQVLRQRLN